MKIPCIIVLLALIGIIHNVSATAVYGLIVENSGINVIVEINNITGEFTFIAQDKGASGFFQGISCFDQSRHTFYYVTDNALNAVDVSKGKELPKANYDVMQVTALVWDNLTSEVILASIPGVYESSSLYAYPATTEKGSHHPQLLANLSAEGIFWALFQTFDPVHRIFYSVFQSNESSNRVLLMHSFHLDNPSNITVVKFPCLDNIEYLTYDAVQNKLVGITANHTEDGYQYYYAFVIEDDGSCSLSMNLEGVEDVTAVTYNPVSATFYFGYVFSESTTGLFIFETKTSKITKVPIGDILYDIEVAY